MKQYKKIAVCLLTICFAFALTACNNSDRDEFTSLQSFEYHFFPEEYEEEYSEYEKVITLEADTDYQFISRRSLRKRNNRDRSYL